MWNQAGYDKIYTRMSYTGIYPTHGHENINRKINHRNIQDSLSDKINTCSNFFATQSLYKPSGTVPFEQYYIDNISIWAWALHYISKDEDYADQSIDLWFPIQNGYFDSFDITFYTEKNENINGYVEFDIQLALLENGKKINKLTTFTSNKLEVNGGHVFYIQKVYLEEKIEKEGLIHLALARKGDQYNDKIYVTGIKV